MPLIDRLDAARELIATDQLDQPVPGRLGETAFLGLRKPNAHDPVESKLERPDKRRRLPEQRRPRTDRLGRSIDKPAGEPASLRQIEHRQR